MGDAAKGRHHHFGLSLRAFRSGLFVQGFSFRCFGSVVSRSAALRSNLLADDTYGQTFDGKSLGCQIDFYGLISTILR